MEKEEKEDVRVLGRIGARELTPEEVENMSGDVHTKTVCTFNFETKTADGDIGEC
jgi:hypothetical protein